MAKTTVELDGSLIRNARKLTGLRTKGQIVNHALDLLIRTESRKGILKYYGTGIWRSDLRRIPAPQKVKIFFVGNRQAIRLPKAFEFAAREVFIRRKGGHVILSPHTASWSAYLAEGPIASQSFMEGVRRTSDRSFARGSYDQA